MWLTLLKSLFKSLLIVIFLLGGIGLFVYLGSFYQSTAHPAPSLQFTTITGKPITLANLRPHPVIVTFWASDCSSCLKEIADLIALYQQFHSRGLEVIAIAMNYDPPNRVVEFVQQRAIPYDIVLDLRGNYAQAFDTVEVTPTTFLIDSQGKIIWQKLGLIDREVLQRKVYSLLTIH
jgi:peroxiredoxin